ncbi:MAG: phytanoyl-CoA dioxygenase family protein [Rhodobacteraceae bacterium]|nr:phytanoyl-CoA dioxygenase family protein [Paracoccaceae bacterium]
MSNATQGASPQELAESYRRDGYLSPVDVISAAEAARHRAEMEQAESEIGPLHYKTKAYTFLRSPLELATKPEVLDLVEQMIGPDILLYNATYIVKEPHTSSHVSWHQDLTFWGLSNDEQVTLWLALSPATSESGCMRMVPGSHRSGRIDHDTTDDPSNVLFLGQTVTGVSESEAVMCPLAPGQASFHHGWTLHASMPNESDDRRIGLNVQYLATSTRQTKHDHDSAMLVRGVDRFRHFDVDEPATTDLDPAALARHAALEARHKQIAGAT